ncbi:cell division protein CrgA [Humidisolicoccus flavus]|uniref:cell division protein CrgA n=1 Tax=Humidisolicoccus flavus TaxID=3111414 RepID=UPI00325425F2
MARIESSASASSDKKNPAWFKPVMFGFMIFGFLWVIVYYISGTVYPVATLGSWNIVIGFGIMFIGFLMTTRWR